MQLNPHYAELNESYLFSTIAHKVAEYQKAHPEADVIRLGIGDVTLPLAAPVIEALHKAVDEMAHKETFRGYGPEQGYDFLREAIQKYYAGRGVQLELGEIFVSDGAKSDLGNLLDLFDVNNTVLVPDPVYPVYVDDNVMAGRTIRYMAANAENHFLPMPDETTQADIVYLCSPNNPTGAAYTTAQLAQWVKWAKEHHAVILYDAAYECFVSEEGCARSIYEVEGAKEVAVEVCSFSKIAGFTGTRCGYTVVPKALQSEGISCNKLWLRRQTTKFNGVPYIVQRGAAAVFVCPLACGVAPALQAVRERPPSRGGWRGVWMWRGTPGRTAPCAWEPCILRGCRAPWSWCARATAPPNLSTLTSAGFRASCASSARGTGGWWWTRCARLRCAALRPSAWRAPPPWRCGP